jgi:hypothetical protein
MKNPPPAPPAAVPRGWGGRFGVNLGAVFVPEPGFAASLFAEMPRPSPWDGDWASVVQAAGLILQSHWLSLCTTISPLCAICCGSVVQPPRLSPSTHHVQPPRLSPTPILSPPPLPSFLCAACRRRAARRRELATSHTSTATSTDRCWPSLRRRATLCCACHSDFGTCSRSQGRAACAALVAARRAEPSLSLVGSSPQAAFTAASTPPPHQLRSTSSTRRRRRRRRRTRPCGVSARTQARLRDRTRSHEIAPEIAPEMAPEVP